MVQSQNINQNLIGYCMRYETLKKTFSISLNYYYY